MRFLPARVLPALLALPVHLSAVALPALFPGRLLRLQNDLRFFRCGFVQTVRPKSRGSGAVFAQAVRPHSSVSASSKQMVRFITLSPIPANFALSV